MARTDRRQRQTGTRVPITAYLTPADRDRHQAAAAREGITFSTYIDQALRERTDRQPVFRRAEYRALAELRLQLQVAGRNLNEMLRRLYIWIDDPATKRPPDGEIVTIAAKETIDRVRRLDDLLSKQW
jgi:hypothetical protein